MNRYRQNGAITVFLSLCSVLFLSLVCTLAESARIQGARAKAAGTLDIGLFSVFGEFEKQLLEKYDVFFLDGSYGSGDYHTEKLRLRLESMMKPNLAQETGSKIAGFEPFKLKLMDSSISGVSLATDEKGEVFYQQAAAYMKENLGTEALLRLQERSNEAERQARASQTYKEEEKLNQSSLQDLNRQQEEQNKSRNEQSSDQQKTSEAIQDDNREGQIPGEGAENEVLQPEPVPPKENPLNIIKKVKKMGILGLVVRDPSKLSQKKIKLSDQPSSRRLEQGNLPVKKQYSGMTGELLFQQYLCSHFSCMTDTRTQGALEYQLEYLAAGKGSDVENLKSVVNKLLLLREGSNFLYALSSQEMTSEALSLAAVLVGAFPVPGLLTVTQTALLLAWAYGESLLDVRCLLDGGKVPLQKNISNWKLSLENIGKITELLQDNHNNQQEGLNYKEYLQMILFTGSHTKKTMRSLDLVESDLRKEVSTRNFRVDACVFQLKAQTAFLIPPLFLKVTNTYLDTRLDSGGQEIQISGGLSYQWS